MANAAEVKAGFLAAMVTRGMVEGENTTSKLLMMDKTKRHSVTENIVGEEENEMKV